ncbi:hypothetical protein [Phocaeicola barnesiae]|uniref:hypothetical protein n=1 Tax=Phocaeicola barnesiae TaxID=376804 RepID=UPI0025A3744B|nr:hypothetical protein [Phocaeicola barnesiae]MDM8253188.1 hypothetical protein [Phocaeicola barnesiae]
MRKKYLSALLFGALLFASAGTFTSCKDYDDDINNLQEQINTIASSLEDLKAQIGTKGVTSVKVEGGQLIVVTDGQSVTYDLPSGVDVEEIEIKDGHLYVGGVDKGAIGGTGSVVTVNEDGVLMIDDKEAGLKVGTEVIIKDASNGVYTISINGETIQLPMVSAALSYINVINADPTEPTFEALYDINKTDVEYSPYKKKLAAGLYTTLDRDLKIVVNPQSADASIYKFALKNSNGDDTELTFKEAQAYNGTLTADEVTSRASSKNGIWVLENAYTRYDNNNLTDIRTNLYKKFKANDVDSPYALTLQATNEGTGTTFNTPYNLSAQLRQMEPTTVKALSMAYTTKGVAAEPIVEYDGDESAVYDYWLTLDQDPLNLQKAQLYGVEIDPVEGHTFTFTKDAGVGNEINFVYNYILVNGTVYQGQTGEKQGSSFTVKFAEELADAQEKPFGDFIAAFDAYLASDKNVLYTGIPNGSTSVTNKETTFFMTKDDYDFSEFYNGLSSDNKLVWDSAIKENTISFELFGGEGGNNADNNNEDLLKNIRYSIDNTKKTIGLQFMVDQAWEAKDDNFKLNTAYELVMTVKDPIANNVVAKLTFPFELQQPTLDITRENGEKALWDNNVLSIYGDLVNDNYMYVPFYEAFSTAYATKYSKFIPGAKYYTLIGDNSKVLYDGEFLGVTYDKLNTPLTEITYSSVASEWNTYINKGDVNNTEILIKADYNFYGVYPATEEQVPDFTLRFASLLGDAKTIEANSEFTSTTVTREIILTDKDFTLVDALKDQFYLFDGVKDDGNVIKRSELNSNQKFEEGTEGFDTDFTLATTKVSAYYYKNGIKTNITVEKGKLYEGDDTKPYNAKLVTNDNTKTRTWEPREISSDKIFVTDLPATEAVKPNYAAIPGGIMIQLPSSIGTTEPVTIEFELVDVFGVTKTLSVTVKAAK